MAAGSLGGLVFAMRLVPAERLKLAVMAQVLEYPVDPFRNIDLRESAERTMAT